jgi:hypothetical protein
MLCPACETVHLDDNGYCEWCDEFIDLAALDD